MKRWKTVAFISALALPAVAFAADAVATRMGCCPLCHLLGWG